MEAVPWGLNVFRIRNDKIDPKYKVVAPANAIEIFTTGQLYS